MPTDEELAAIARGLSEAQKRTLLTQREPDGRGKWPLRHALLDKGLTTPWPHPWRLTPLGIRVRAHLEKAHG